MNERQTVTLYNAQQAHQALQSVWRDCLKPMMMAGHRMVLEVRPEKRSLAENRMLHALLSEISRKVEWAGKKHELETWKRLLTAAWTRARGEHVELIPAVDGHGVDIVFRRTSQLTKAECAELIEFVLAWAAENGVEMSSPESTGFHD